MHVVSFIGGCTYRVGGHPVLQFACPSHLQIMPTCDSLCCNLAFHLGKRDADIARQRCSQHNVELELAEGGGRRPNLIMGAKWYMGGWIVIAMAKCGVRMYSNSIDMYVYLPVALSEGFGSVLRVQCCE